MKILELNIDNFLGIGTAKLHLDDRGLVLIQGENQDDPSANSNGAGKSSLSDALSWCLYGVTARGASGDDVVNTKAKKNCAVETLIKDGDDYYIVSRFRKHKDKKNVLVLLHSKHGNRAQTWADLTKGTDKLTQVEVDRVLGCSPDVFNAAIYMGQERMPDLPAMTDKHLKTLVEESAGIDRLYRAYEIARERATQAKQTLAQAEQKLERAEQKLADVKDQRDSHQRVADQWTATQQDKIDLAEDEMRSVLKAYKKAKAEVDSFDLAALEAEEQRIEQALQGRHAEEAQRKDHEDEVRVCERDELTRQSALSAAFKEMRSAKQALADVDARVGQPCSECGKEYCEEDIDEARKLAQKKLASVCVDAKQAKAQYERAVQARASASKRLESFKRAMTDVSDLLRAQSVTVSRRAEYDSAKRECEQARSNAQHAKQRLDKLKAETNTLIALVEQDEKIIDELANTTLPRLKGELKNVEQALGVTKAAVDVFGPAGVRAQILDTVTPFLNDRTAHYLATLTDGGITATWSTLSTTAKGDLREKFNIEVASSNAKKFGLLSGGQKRKVRLACAMALQDLVASRATKPIDLFIADEVDHALDDAGLERLMTILDEKARQHGTVLVISHNALSDWVREQVTVVMKGGQSTITGAIAA